MPENRMIPEVAPRGVYMHPYRGPHGCIYLFAVDGAGTLVGEQVVLESQDPYAATNALRDLLDAADPEREGKPASRPTALAVVR